jgi:hypothetical protein
VILTGNEVGITSSIVAAVAVIAGYLGVRSANQSALDLAREERAENRRNEILELRRSTYARCMEVMYELNNAAVMLASVEKDTPDSVRLPVLKRVVEAMQAVLNSSAQIKLIGPPGSRTYQ